MGPAVTATFGGDTKDLAEKSQQSISIVRNFASATGDYAREAGNALREVGAGLLAGFGASAVVNKVIGFLDAVREKAIHLHQLSMELGVSTDAIQAFDKAAVKAGGSIEQAQRIWERARLSLSQLAAGNEETQKAFEKLHLSAQDFVGLNLQQALEKIARAYHESKDEAGAYAALMDILGARAAPQLIAALDKLGTEGFDKLIEKNRALNKSLSSETITTVVALKAAWSSTFGDMTNTVGNLAAASFVASKALGALPKIAFDLIRGVKPDLVEIFHLEEMRAQGLERQNLELLAAEELRKRQKAQLEDVLTLNDQILRNDIETTKGREKLNALAAEYVSLTLTANSQARTEQERTVAAAEAKKVKTEYDKLSVQLAEEETKKQIELLHQLNEVKAKVQETADKLKFESLPATEQLAFLEEKRAAIERDRADVGKDTIYWQESQVKINELDLDILKQKLEIDKERVKAAKDYIEAENDWLQSVMDSPVTGITAGGLNPEYVSGLSTVSLQAKINQLSQYMANKRQDYFAKGINPEEADRDASGLAIVIAQLQQELSYRSGFSAAYSQGGQSGALGYFLGKGGDALNFDQALSGMSNWSKGLDQTNQHLTEINGTLKQIFN